MTDSPTTPPLEPLEVHTFSWVQFDELTRWVEEQLARLGPPARTAPLQQPALHRTRGTRQWAKPTP